MNEYIFVFTLIQYGETHEFTMIKGAVRNEGEDINDFINRIHDSYKSDYYQVTIKDIKKL